MNLEHFEQLARGRRATRHFRPDPLPAGILERLLDIAHWAPSGYNLQPTHFVVVTDPALRPALCKACMDQIQVVEAPAVVIFTGDRRVMENHFEKTLALDLAAGAINPAYEQKLRTFVPLAFARGPLGLGWLWKATLMPLLRWFRPIPGIPVVDKRYWLAKQVMLAAMNFMLAASAAGLATVPMEGFDEYRVRRLLKIPRSHIIPLIVCVGYAADGAFVKTRLPLAALVHHECW